jgi:hypothetical protein
VGGRDKQPGHYALTTRIIFGADSFAGDDFAFAVREGLLPVPSRQADSACIGVDLEIQNVKSEADESFASRAHAIAWGGVRAVVNRRTCTSWWPKVTDS